MNIKFVLVFSFILSLKTINIFGFDLDVQSQLPRPDIFRSNKILSILQNRSLTKEISKKIFGFRFCG